MQPPKSQTASNKALHWKTRLIINLGALLVRIWFTTCRVKIVGRTFTATPWIHATAGKGLNRPA